MADQAPPERLRPPLGAPASGTPEQSSGQMRARRQPRQPSVEIGKSLFKTLQADSRAGRTRSLSARGAASLAMYLAFIEKQEGTVDDERNPAD